MADGQRPVPWMGWSCRSEPCAEEHSYPSEMLYWWAGSDEWPAGWYCENDYMDIEMGDDYPDSSWARDSLYHYLEGLDFEQLRAVVLRRR